MSPLRRSAPNAPKRNSRTKEHSQKCLPKQIAANQANAQRSSGPKTQEGKATSSKNHTSHGLTYRGGMFILLLWENAQGYDQLVVNLKSEYGPDLLKLRAEKRKNEIGFESQKREQEEHTRQQEQHEMKKKPPEMGRHARRSQALPPTNPD